MPNYVRSYVPGGTFFFTLVTHERRPFLAGDLARRCLREAFEKILARQPFDLFAIVLLPDHLHTIWMLPPGDDDYSSRWGAIKEAFTRSFLKQGGIEGTVSRSRKKHRERAVWQRRFWEHTCRDEEDLKRYLDYLHWNPCKHGLVKHVAEYPWSTFNRFAQIGEYESTWGDADPCPDWG